MTGPVVVAVCVGRVRSEGRQDASDPLDRPWISGIFKTSVTGRVRVTATGLEGDGHADVADHGGFDKAICAYPAGHYDDWQVMLANQAFAFGAFGENLTIAGLDEGRVCVGDRWQCGSLLLEVSQPRQPCWKLGRKWRRSTFPEEVVKSGRTGWYFRVRLEGDVEVGDSLVLIDRPNPEWTIAAANQVMHQRIGDVGALARLAALSTSWKTTLARRAEAH